VAISGITSRAIPDLFVLHYIVVVMVKAVMLAIAVPYQWWLSLCYIILSIHVNAALTATTILLSHSLPKMHSMPFGVNLSIYTFIPFYFASIKVHVPQSLN
jgi:hypothetical protein